MFLEPTDEFENKNTILKLNSDKSPGADDVTVSALKVCVDIVNVPI